MKLQQKGFTLIELLVVIAIIGLLSTLAVVSLSTARQKSRDTRRVADIKQIQSALEMYYNDQQTYPLTANVTSGSAIATSGVTYMSKMPADPGSNSYTYVGSTTAATYTLTYKLEGAMTGITNSGIGLSTATPAGISL